jgi:hypothetical protein
MLSGFLQIEPTLTKELIMNKQALRLQRRATAILDLQAAQQTLQRQVRTDATLTLTVRTEQHKLDAHGYGPISSYRVFALHRTRTGAPLLILEPAYDPGTGRVRYRTVAAYDAAAPVLTERRQRGQLGLSQDNITAVTTAAALLDATAMLHPVQTVPSLPGCLVLFPAAAPPVIEHTPTNRALAAAHGKTVNELHEDSVLDFLQDADGQIRFWAERVAGDAVPEGCVHLLGLPHYLFARQPGVVYPVHPVTGFRAPALTDGEAHDGWACIDGHVLPEPQHGVAVVATPSVTQGRQLRNPALTVLLEAGLIAENLSDPCDWQDNPEARYWAPYCSDVLKRQPALALQLVREVIAAFQVKGLECSATQARRHLLAPAAPVLDTSQAAVQLVRLASAPSSASMTWQLPGLDCDFYDAGPWQSEFQTPVPARMPVPSAHVTQEVNQ